MGEYTETQIAQYLERIGLEGNLSRTAETLTKIVRAHYASVPYENLNILKGELLRLSPESLFDKIVLHHRGGYCFELNGALGHLLSGMGFSVTHLSARFVMGEPEGQIPMRRHRVLHVRLPEGDFLCDAGVMREAARIALRIDTDEIQTDGVGEYRVQDDPFYGKLVWQRLPGKEFAPFFGFTMEPQTDVDFVMPSFYCERHPDSPFIHHRMVGIYTERGSWNLVGNELRRTKCGEILECREIPEKEIPSILEEYFGLK